MRRDIYSLLLFVLTCLLSVSSASAANKNTLIAIEEVGFLPLWEKKYVLEVLIDDEVIGAAGLQASR